MLLVEASTRQHSQRRSDYDEVFNRKCKTGGVKPPVLCLDSPQSDWIFANASELSSAILFSVSRLL
jgi:hypothetical protein